MVTALNLHGDLHDHVEPVHDVGDGDVNAADGTMSTDLYATHYYSEPGTYTASLTVYNNHGSDVTTYQIEVPSADPGDDGTEWALVAAVVLIAFVSGALIARRFL